MQLSSGQRVAAYRFIAYATAGVAVTTVLFVCISLPVAYNIIYHIKKSANADIHFCKQRNNIYA
ncbi:hypothetical protein ANCCAN_06001 [Ancylostoma caninum]|uniref:Nematode cuticle collagen N-terminal domain-containing protein n=1 Tax=Ancylostoma caninum TaxID=29170 RepID=A0A368GX83_ANCCA|nr:hypothetical protein ANCCAN_06001 [Ancylostoma caninum]